MRSRIVTWCVLVALAAFPQVVGAQQQPVKGKVEGGPLPMVAPAPAPAPASTPAPEVKPEVAPILSELAALKLENIVYAIENAQLKIAQLQSDLAKTQAEAQGFALSLQKPGYNLARGQAGAWVYMKQETPKPPPAAEKK